MATKKEKEVKQLAPVEFTDADGNRLVLWFTRATILKMDREHWNVNAIQEQFEQEQIQPIIKLVWYGLWANKPNVTMEEAEELVFAVGLETTSELATDMYMYTFDTLRQGDGKNAKWTMVK